MLDWNKIIFSDEISFNKKALKVFDYQLKNNEIYRRYCKALGVGNPNSAQKIPLLPIKAFKDTEVISADEDSEFNDSQLKFKSSGTSAMQPSTHQVLDASIYEQSLLHGFRQFYDLENAVIWGYTPGYSENPHSSLIYMIQKLIEQDDTGCSRFLPLDEPLNKQNIESIKKSGKQLILFGAAFGLLDLLQMKAAKLPSNSIIIETGGMKTHRRELTRDEMHQKLAEGFGLDISRIHSEYGMCELLSQAYSTGGNWFRSIPWMQVSVHNPREPQHVLPPFQKGLIGVIDLANVHSCSFILTGDKGMMDDKGRFQVLGRWNSKNLRGCNFLIEED
ncbi:MAG TPA: hypothetical protein VK106_04170 [Balneolaceae bacterium]|nr:hypothetical protein [Balneolaceae bacterium]